MHPAMLLALYCLACVACSLLGGWVPLVVHLTHRRMQVAISFVSGVVLGIGVLHLVPHSFAVLGSIDSTVLWVMIGFLFMFFLERFFHFHHHDAPEDPLSLVPPTVHGEQAHESHDHTGHHAAHDHAHAHVHDQAAALSGFSLGGAAIGLTLHGLVDGVAIAAAVQAESAHAAAALAGIGTALAVALHKPFDALTIGTLMAASGHSVAARQWLNALYALVTPLGVVLFYAAASSLGEPSGAIGQVLGFAAGAFICIASSDLLPELHFHGHDRTKLSLALVAGIALAWATVFVEGGHEHPHEQHAPRDAEHEHDADHEHGGLHEQAQENHARE